MNISILSSLIPQQDLHGFGFDPFVGAEEFRVRKRQRTEEHQRSLQVCATLINTLLLSILTRAQSSLFTSMTCVDRINKVICCCVLLPSALLYLVLKKCSVDFLFCLHCCPLKRFPLKKWIAISVLGSL
jgi:hypothetical protein